MNNLFVYDKQVMAEGFRVVCGIDEAGRGPLAGPVYAAAAVLPPDLVLEGLNDSKKLTAGKREALYEEITAKAAAYCIATASAKEIDELNILQATMLAMRRAVQGLAVKPCLLLVDGNSSPEAGIATRTVVKGDGTSACIAAASVLAKVARDRCLAGLDQEYPQYQFARHKGYPTKLHYEMLDLYGPCPEHRQSFLKKWRAAREQE